MSEKIKSYKEFWDDNDEFYLEEMSYIAATINSKRDWISEYKFEVHKQVRLQTGYAVPDWDWIREAMQETGTIDGAVDMVIGMVAELDGPETVFNTPTLSAFERNR